MAKAAKLPIPEGVLDQHVIALGKTRSGKSSVLRLLTEHMLDRSMPVCIIDPKGDWWGLKSSADGKQAGYPLVIFGGTHADVPINQHSGTAVAEIVATGNRPALIDLGGWMPGERTRFFVDFASAFFRHARGRRCLVIDEVHNFAPQGRVLDPDSGKMLHWANRLISEGGGKGVILLSASQRPQKVHKDFVTSNETLIAMRVIHPLDRAAVKEWLDGAGDKQVSAEILAQLANMKRGEGYVWSPEIKFGPVQIQFPLFSTYDSFAAPAGDETVKLKGWAAVDLDEVKDKLAAAVEEAKANDPKALRAEIGRLRKEMADAAALAAKNGQVPDPVAISTAEQRGYDRGRSDGEHSAIEAMTADATAFADRLQGALDATLQIIAAHRAKPLPIPDRSRTLVTREAPVARPPPAPIPVRPTATVEGLTPAKQRILDAIAWAESIGLSDVPREIVAFLADASPNSSAFANNMGSLRTASLIDYRGSGIVVFTDAGRGAANQPAAALTHDDLVSRIGQKIPPAQFRILQAAIGAYPSAISRDDVATAVAASPTSSAFANNLGRIRTLTLITYPDRGSVRADDKLFPGVRR